MNDTRIGWMMMTAAWLLIAGLLYVLFAAWLDREQNPNRQVMAARSGAGGELVLERNRAGHYVAPGTINGHPVVFLLDTGATLVSVPAARGPALGLQPGALGTAQTANGEVAIRFTRIAHLTLGPFEWREVRASLNPGLAEDQVLLGMSALKHLEFVQRGRTLILRRPQS